MNYTDTGPPDDGRPKDMACGARTYNDHKGTDFALLDEKAMTEGVAVIAAANGKVIRARDGEEDRWPTDEDLKAVRQQRKECGNAILLDHGNGWQTMYCHLRQESIKVSPGDVVQSGQQIGFVGLSGLTEHPHLHFGVLHKGSVINPFTGTDISKDCNPKPDFSKTLWKPDLGLGYEAVSIFKSGFMQKAPLLEKISKDFDVQNSLPANSPALVFLTTIWGISAGDTIHLNITAPDGSVFAEEKIVQEKNRARQLFYIGRKAGVEPFPSGMYTGTVTLIRTSNGESKRYEDKIKVTLD